MLRNYLVVAWRNLRRNRLYALINVAGLAVGLAACLLILLYVRRELSYDRFHQNVARMYRVVDEMEMPARDFKAATALTPYPMARALTADFPEVVGAVCLEHWENARRRVGRGDRWFYESGVAYAEPSFFEVFTFPFCQGDPRTALSEPNSLVLTASMARRYFGGDNPLGQRLSVDGVDYQVAGVLEDVPANSHLRLDFLLPFPRDLSRLTGPDTPSNWMNHSFHTYILLRDGAAPEELEAKLPAFLERHAGEQMALAGARIHSRLQPISSIHLHSQLQYELGPNGDIRYVFTFSAIAGLILLVAGVNFVNLSTARSVHRAREVGVRKAVGARRGQLACQFLGESLLPALAAGALAAVLVELALPAVERLGGSILSAGLDLRMWGGLAGLVAAVGLLAGAYPALRLSGCRATAGLRGVSDRGKQGRRFRRGLVVAQFAISIFLMVATVAVKRQLDHIRAFRLGFDREQVLVLPLPEEEHGRQGTITEGLRQVSGVAHAAAASSVPGRMASQDAVRPAGGGAEDTQLVYMLFVDRNYLETLGIQLAAGRGFSRDGAGDGQAFLVNQAAMEGFGWQGIEGKELEWLHIGAADRVLKRGPVVGLVKDFNFRSLHHAIEPLVIQTSEPGNYNFLLLKLQPGDLGDRLKQVEAAWRRLLPEQPFEYSFLDEDLDTLYRSEQRYGWILGSFSLLVIFVACLGLFGLASFAAEQRTKEIGIRKVLGASVPSIVVLLSKEFTYLVVAANLIAWPVGYFAMQQWLEGFAYRVELGPGAFVLGGLLALGIAWLTVSWQAVRAALANPVEALRYE
jgi:putative ABC transport system permease protein